VRLCGARSQAEGESRSNAATAEGGVSDPPRAELRPLLITSGE
jgi:hypothetical protein